MDAEIIVYFFNGKFDAEDDDTKFSLGMNWYKIEDEPNHFDWISENSVEGYR